jgi:bifunctional ADP-heptose synthase (sugar kinase/adenylyltransferase)
VVANLAALGVQDLRAIGLAGRDLFGRQLADLLDGLRVSTEGFLTSQPDWDTLVYSKPCMGDRELNRIDFGPFNRISEPSVDALAEELDRAAGQVKTVILNQQLPSGVTTRPMIERINAIASRHANCLFIADSRHRSEFFEGVMLKLNAREAARLLGQSISSEEDVSLEAAGELAHSLARRTRKPVLITCGKHGLVAADATNTHAVPGVPLKGPTDSVGAGDTVVAALAAALASGSDLGTAARLANFAAAVTVQKLQTTGTASPEEIRGLMARTPT